MDLRIEKPETSEQFKAMLGDAAPLPWEIDGRCIVDVNGNPLLASIRGIDPTVLHAIVVAVNTCGGFKLEA